MADMKLRRRFEDELRALPETKVELWKDSDLMCVFYRGKEIAHFHDHEEIDVRLSQAFIKKEQLRPLDDSKFHPNRSKQSRWMQFRFRTDKEVEALLSLIRRLIKDEYESTGWGKSL
jgi:hypothetical protein